MYFVPEIIPDDNGVDVEHPTLGQYYLEEMAIETETHFEVIEDYHMQSVHRFPGDPDPRSEPIPKEEQDFWVDAKHRHFGYKINGAVAEKPSVEKNFIPDR